MTLVERAGRNRLVDALTLIAAIGGTVLVARSAGVAAAWWVAPFLAAVLLSVRTASLAVHELGHLVAGCLAGWRWETFKLGPVVVARDGRSSRVDFGGGRRIRAAGQVVFTPPTAAVDTALRRIAMLAGGPAASAALACAAFISWRAVEAPVPRILLGVTALYSAIVFVTTVLPFESAGNLSDGGSILFQLRRRNQRRNGHVPDVGF